MKVFSKINFHLRSSFKFQFTNFKQFCKYSRDLPHLNVGTIGMHNQ